MNVLHLVNNLRREGAQTMILNLASTPGAARHVVCARTPGGDLQPRFAERGVPVYTPASYARAFDFVRTLRFIETVLEREAIDLINAHMADAAFLGWLAASRQSLPLVITHHGYAILPPCHYVCRNVYRLVLAAAARFASRNVAVSDAVAVRLRQVIWLGNKRIEVVDNGVRVPKCSSGGGQGRFSAATTILSVGRLQELKGQRQLIAAAARLAGRFPAARFVIVGDGPMRRQLEHEVASRGLRERFLFTGSVDDVESRLKEASVFVSTSRFEGLPVAVLEAMAWGVPVVVSDVPGNRNVVASGETGLIYALDDIAALADAIAVTLDDTESSHRRAQNARRTVEQRYDIERVARQYEKIYARALSPV